VDGDPGHRRQRAEDIVILDPTGTIETIAYIAKAAL
jgi:hypothetical protein